MKRTRIHQCLPHIIIVSKESCRLQPGVVQAPKINRARVRVKRPGCDIVAETSKFLDNRYRL